MAKQTSFLRFKGSVEEVTFYKSKDGDFMRKKGGVDKSRIMNDPAFARTRENNEEFGNATSAGKILRDAVQVLGKKASDRNAAARLTQILSKIRILDDVNIRGKRCVAVGIGKEGAYTLLKGFDFNVNAKLKKVLLKPYQVDTESGEIIIDSFTPQQDISMQAGATHVVFRSGFASVNFETGETEMTVSDPVRVAIDAPAQAISLLPANAPAVAGVCFFLLSIDFVQLINNADYLLNNNSSCVLSIVEMTNPAGK